MVTCVYKSRIVWYTLLMIPTMGSEYIMVECSRNTCSQNTLIQRKLRSTPRIFLYSILLWYRLGPGAVVELPAWKSEIAGSSPALRFKFQRNKMFLPHSLVIIQYFGEPRAVTECSVLCLKPPGLKFLDDSVIWFISPSSECSLVYHVGLFKSCMYQTKNIVRNGINLGCCW